MNKPEFRPKRPKRLFGLLGWICSGCMIGLTWLEVLGWVDSMRPIVIAIWSLLLVMTVIAFAISHETYVG